MESVTDSQIIKEGTDWDLILACRQGDERAWKRVVNKYERLVFSIPLNYGLGQNDAADIVQLTFMMLIQGLDGLQKNSHLGGWLATVARRNTWHLLHRRRRESLENDDLGDNATLPDESSQNDKERWELYTWLQDGLAQLDEPCRSLLLALYFDPEQPSYSDVAERMGMAVGSIGPTRSRCLERLRDIMRDRS
jgi:RNA polymerase sigma factor (sigma-70 family)